MEMLRYIANLVALIALPLLLSAADATPSWATLLSTTLEVGNGSAAIVNSAVLISPDDKSWRFGVQIGTSLLLEGESEELTPCTFGVFKSTGTATTWEWVGVNSTDMAFATVSFSAGSELQLIVDWRNGTNDSVAWSSGTGQDAQAVALSNDGQLLLLDAQNKTIWQRPGVPELIKNGTLSPCPSNLCLPPSPPPSPSPPPPPSPPSASPPPPPSGSTSLYPSLALILLLSLFV